MTDQDLDGSLPIGEKIRRLREGAALTVSQLAERASLSPEELERIEQDMISPALGVLIRISDGLGVRLGHFFEQGPRKAFSVARAAEQKAFTRFASKSGMNFGQVYCSLAAEKRERVMEPFLITQTTPTDPDGNPLELEQFTTHSGEEFIYVLEGRIEVQIEEQVVVLDPGDSIYYDSTVRHRITHRGPGKSRTLSVVHLPRRT